MRYLITHPDHKPFYTFNFIPENHWVKGMVVFDLYKAIYMDDGKTWIDAPIDSF